MARLVIKTVGLDSRSFELKLGANRIGRSPDSEFPISHPTVSAIHCELTLVSDGILIRDLESTNGTYVNGRQIREALLEAGQTVRLGDVELLVESTEATVAIPKFTNPEIAAPPVVLSNGAIVCPRHPKAQATYRCTQCREIMCEACVHRIRRKGGRAVLLLCPVCSGALELIGGPRKKKKKSLFARVGETVKLKFTRTIHLNQDEP